MGGSLVAAALVCGSVARGEGWGIVLVDADFPRSVLLTGGGFSSGICRWMMVTEYFGAKGFRVYSDEFAYCGELAGAHANAVSRAP